MTETEATCKREIELEIPAENVQKTVAKVAKDLARVARIPGFRPGKAPLTLIQRRYAEDIKGEVVQTLVPEFLEKELTEKKLVPVTQPRVDQVEFQENGPLKVRAVFEVLPEFTLGNYKGLQVEVDDMAIGDADVDKTLEEMRERTAAYIPVEGRSIADGDFAMLSVTGTPQGGGEQVHAENVVCNVGAEETLPAFTENLRGATTGESRRFDASYPADYPDAKLAGKNFSYTVEVQSIKEKRLPELNDEFAREVGAGDDVTTLAALRVKVAERLEAAREERQHSQANDKILELLVKQHEFPVPEALVEHQMGVRLEAVVRSMARQGVDPRAVNVDWVALRSRQRDRAVEDVKAELLLDRIAEAEHIDASDEDVNKEIERIAERSGESAPAVRARLTKQGALDRMKSKLRSDRTIDWLHREASIQKSARREK
jgi:trigger factor